jgi:ATP-binding cassette subfamily B protein
MMRRSLRPSRHWIIIGIISALTWTACKVAIPILATKAVDQGVAVEDRGALFRWTGIIAAAAVILAIANGLRRYAAFVISLRSEADLRREMFAHLQGLHFAYHDEMQTGQLLSRANTDLRQIQMFLVFLPVSGANIVMIIGVAAVLFSINAKLAFVSLVSLPFLNVAATIFSKRLHPESVDLQQRLAGVSTLVEESVTGIRVVKGFGAEQVLSDRMIEAAAGVRMRSLAMAKLRAGFTPLLELLPNVGLIGILYVGGHEVLAGRLSLGELVAFNFYVLQLIFPLRLTAHLVAAASRASASAARVYEVLAEEPDIADGPHARPLPDGPGEVTFQSVSFAYPAGGSVLRGLDLRVQGGTSVAIVGATGSGKSTIARLLPRFYDVDQGQVCIDGADVRGLLLSELRTAVAMVFEDTFLFTDTVRANIAFARPDAPRAQVERAARLAGAHEFITSLPKGYDTILGERGFSLSGGQRQRIAIARAILADPRILILDDATSSVDPTKEHEIRAALEEVMRGRTTIIIAHRPATIALAERVVLVGDGRILAEGTHESLLHTSLAYRAVLAEADKRERQQSDDTEEEVPA